MDVVGRAPQRPVSFFDDVAARTLRPLRAVAGCSMLVDLLLLVPALFMLQVFDRVLASGSGETLAVLLLGVALALLMMSRSTTAAACRAWRGSSSASR